MMEIPGYTVRGLFQTTNSSLLFRAERQADQRPVIVKTPRMERPGPRERARYLREYELLQRLHGVPGILGALGCEVHQESPFLLLEDMGGQALSELRQQPMEPSRFLSLAISLAATLAEVHRRGIVHRDLKPANILRSESGGAWLLDFGLATLQQVEHVEAAPATLLEGTLAYMSPEQSGRMNRAVDYRTDLYALGVTLYELLTGHPPFHGKDALEWLHAHIAQAPIPPHTRVASVHPVLSGVVLKLLAKPAEERYQSADGLKADLERCQHQLRQGLLKDFPLGQDDQPPHFQLPQRLYGRETQLLALHESFERVVREGRPEWIWVSGYAGIGKSSVVQELHKPVLSRRGFFLSGKFNQLQRDVPYATVAQVLRGLVQQLLAGGNEELEVWRQHLLEACEGNGQLLVELAPQFEQLVGPQSPVPELLPAETRHRFNRLFQRLLGVFARAGRPLVLFLDDLQWADPASLRLLQSLATLPETPPHLLIGAYRDNEVSASHPLANMMAEARKAGVRGTTVHLKPLSLTHTRQLVAEALPQASPELVDPLAQLLQEKTGGNPFFLLQLFQTLHQEGLVTRGPDGHWRWDEVAVRAREYSANVVDFMAGRLRQLPVPTQRLLQQAACVGNTFALDTLALVSRLEVLDVEQRLEPALLEGLVVRTDPQHSRFFHDRIQQAAYSLIAEEDRPVLHLEIGRLLWARLAPAELHERLFEVVGQLNAGAPLLTDPEERRRLARLNLEAGLRAKASTAHRTAIDCFTMAWSLLPGDPWQSEPELAFELRLEQARCESASGNLAEARRIIDDVLPKAPTRQHLVAGYQLQGEILLTTGEAKAAAASLLAALARFGVIIPAQPTWEEAVAVREELETLLRDRPVESLLDLPVMTDPEVKTVVGLMVALISPAFFVSESLLTLELCKLITLTLRHGNTAATGVGYAWYGLVTSGKFRDCRRGYEFGRLAQAVTERYQGTAYRSRVLFTLGQLSAWVRPLPAVRELYLESFQHAIQSGDYQAASFSRILLSSLPMFMGTELPEVYRETVAGTDFCRKINFRSTEDSIRILQCFVQQMRGLNDGFTTLSLGTFTEAYFESSNNLATQRSWYFITKARSRFMCGAYEEARQAAEQARPLLFSQLGRIFLLDYHHFRALALAACYREASAEQQVQYLEQLHAHQQQLADWSASCPETFQPVERMVFAELKRLRGKPEAAMQAYEEAIQAAHTHGLIQHVALASELAARFWKERGYSTIATSYARQAREAYSQWGAEGKVRHMDEQWPRLADKSTGGPGTTFDSGPTTQLDALSLVKAQQAISSEINLQTLVSTLMSVALQSAGAQRGALLLSQGDELQVKAVVEASPHEAGNGPRSQDHELPWPVLSYVKRTGEHVLIDDTAQPHPFSSAPFFAQSPARSLLCLPLTRNQQLRGMMYLENSLAPGAFSPGRITLLQHLASHAIISLENAQLYAEVRQAEAALRTANEDLEVRVEERTRELKQAQAHLLETARLVGMAEVASNVLHEVGNTLTSLMVSTGQIRDALAAARVDRLRLAVDLLEKNQSQLPDFLTHDPQGRHMVAYLSGLASRLEQERTTLQEDLKDMAGNVERVRSIVALQQTHARASLMEEECDLAEAVEEALRLKQSQLQQAGVQVSKTLEALPPVTVDRHRLMTILHNLLINAHQALEAVAPGERRLELRLWGDGQWAHLEVEDTGQGIALEVHKRLFSQGFSTRKDGHGLGLHSSALSAQLMGAQLTLESRGAGLGATATLKLPL
jgi:predicted ATPase/signal transduction histidine kinase/tRNA A-37 threonylcarbamoyl transferase component Bud32